MIIKLKPNLSKDSKDKTVIERLGDPRLVLKSKEDLKMLGEKMKVSNMFSFDTEFNDLDKALSPHTDFMLAGISISFGTVEESYYVPIYHLEDENANLDDVAEFLKPQFEREDITLIGHNISIDFHAINSIGIFPVTKNIIDTMIYSWLVDENEFKGLKDCTKRLLGVDQTKFNDVLKEVPKEVKSKYGYGATSKVPFNLVSLKEGSSYAIADAYFTYQISDILGKKLLEEKMDTVYKSMYVPFIWTIYNMERKGITVDEEKLKKMGVDMQVDLDELECKMLELAGVEVSFTSTQQMSQLLFGYDGFKNPREDLLKASFGFPIKYKTEKGKPQVNDKSLSTIVKSDYKVKRKKEGQDLCLMLLKFKKLQKLKTAFVDGLLKLIYPDGKIHPHFNIVGTDSGRISCISEGTPITIVNGRKPIEDIKQGDLVYCYDDSGNPRISKITRHINNGVRPCIKIKWRSTDTHDYGELMCGELMCTPDHKIRLRSGEWIRADRLVKGDKLTHIRTKEIIHDSHDKKHIQPTKEEFIQVYFRLEGNKQKIMKELNIGRVKCDNLIDKYDVCFNHEVMSIEFVGDRQVYDLEVEKYHNFIASEICVHNCSKPNLMQLPNAQEGDKYQIRDVFIGSMNDDGIRNRIISADFSNLEMRVLAHFSKDVNLVSAFKSNADTHGDTAVKMFDLDCSPSEVKKSYPMLRQVAKIINFMLMYGGSAYALCDTLEDEGVNMSDPETLKKEGAKDRVGLAQAYMDKYFSAYSGVSKFIRNQKRTAHRRGYTLTLVGRKRRLKDINSSNFKTVGYQERLSVNSPVQGSAADIMINAQNKIDGTVGTSELSDDFYERIMLLDSRSEILDKLIDGEITGSEALKQMGCKMLVQIHDEILLECPEEYCDEACILIREYMIHPFGKDVALNVPLEIGADWGSSYQCGH